MKEWEEKEKGWKKWKEKEKKTNQITVLTLLYEWEGNSDFICFPLFLNGDIITFPSWEKEIYMISKIIIIKSSICYWDEKSYVLIKEAHIYQLVHRGEY